MRSILAALLLATAMPAYAADAPATAHAKIAVTKWQPAPYEDGEVKLVRIHVEENFSGDLTGAGTVEFLQALRADGSANFVGYERFHGTLGAKQGTFLLQDHGTLVGDHVSGKWVVVPGSGTGALAGLHGEGAFDAKLGQASEVTLTYGFN